MLPLMRIVCLAAATAAAEPPAELRWSFESIPPLAPAKGVRLVSDGAAGSAVSFSGPDCRLDLGSCPVDSTEPFAIGVSLRTREGGFCTPVMAREGDAVGLSIILGRRPGCVSFESWSWGSVRLISTSRVDDGRWHRVEVEYEPGANAALLLVDGKTEAWGVLGSGRSPNATLRLGNNIGCEQPFSGEIDELSIVRGAAALPLLKHTEGLALLAPIVSEDARAAQLNTLRHALVREFDVPRGDVDAWKRRRAEVRSAVAECLGLSPQPPRRGLEFTSHGELVGGEVRVQRVSWTSWPDYRATGWLWTSQEYDPLRKHPAMLMPHGHWAHGAIEDVVQVRAARFARAGYVVLVPDSVHVEDLASGVNSVGAMTWNNIRAIDVLCERDDVDFSRIGCTGASGGAQQTMYLMAMEDRIAAAAPVCMICRYQEILAEHSSHCGCNHVPGMAAAADQPEMCAALAPRPALFISATGDWTRSFPSQGWPGILAAYGLLGAKDQVHQRQFNAGHGYDAAMRAEAYAFFDPILKPSSPEAREDGFNAFALDALGRLGPPSRAPDQRSMAREHAARRGRVHSFREAAPGMDWSLGDIRLRSAGNAAKGSPWERWTAAGKDEVEVPFLAKGLGSEGASGPLVVVVAASGRSGVLLSPPAWLDRAARVVVVEPRFCGEWAECASAWRRNAILLGRGEGYQAAMDIARVAEGAGHGSEVHLVALGTSGVSALMAAGVSSRVARVVVEDLGPSFAVDGNRLPECPGILRFGDIDELMASAPAGCTVTAGGSRTHPQRLAAEEIGQALK